MSGIGLVIAAYAALPVGLAATVALWGGSVVSLLGIPDLIFSWKRNAAEKEKLLAERDKLAAETRKLDAETTKILAESEKITANDKILRLSLC